MDILTFIDTKLDEVPHPAQRFVLKLIFGIPLDDNPFNLDLNQPVPRGHIAFDDIADTSGMYHQAIPIQDWDGSNKTYLSEVDFLRYLYDKGQSNIREQEERRGFCLRTGRRAGKSTMGCWISAYVIYRVLQLSDPQKYFGLPKNETLQVLLQGPNAGMNRHLRLQVGELLQSIRLNGLSSPSCLLFQTMRDKSRSLIQRTPVASIRLGFHYRGVQNVCAVFDEYASLPQETWGKSVVLKDGRRIALSSPGENLKPLEKRDDVINIHIPTWNMNPTIPQKSYETARAQYPKQFMVEYGGEYLEDG